MKKEPTFKKREQKAKKLEKELLQHRRAEKSLKDAAAQYKEFSIQLPMDLLSLISKVMLLRLIHRPVKCMVILTQQW